MNRKIVIAIAIVVIGWNLLMVGHIVYFYHTDTSRNNSTEKYPDVKIRITEKIEDEAKKNIDSTVHIDSSTIRELGW